MDKYAVVQLAGSGNGREVRIIVVTPWTYHEALIDSSLASHREIDPGKVYGKLSLPDTVTTKRGRR